MLPKRHHPRARMTVRLSLDSLSRHSECGLSVARTSQTLVSRARIATCWNDRLVGLIGQPPLEPDQGLLIYPCKGIHTIGLHYSIGAIFLNEEMFVVNLRHRIGPFCPGIYVPEAVAVIELSPKALRESELCLNDQIVCEAQEI